MRALRAAVAAAAGGSSVLRQVRRSDHYLYSTAAGSVSCLPFYRGDFAGAASSRPLGGTARTVGPQAAATALPAFGFRLFALKGDSENVAFGGRNGLRAPDGRGSEALLRLYHFLSLRRTRMWGKKIISMLHLHARGLGEGLRNQITQSCTKGASSK